MPKTIRQTKTSINYSIDTPYLIMKKLTPQQQKREYTALRDIVNKRIKRMSNAKVVNGVNPRESEFYKKWEKGVPRIRDIHGNQLPYILSALKKSVREPESTIKGYREAIRRRVAGLQAAGYKGITIGNFQQFTKFMEQFRAKKLDHVVGSPEVAEFWTVIQKKKIAQNEFFKHYRAFIQNAEAIKRMRKPIKSGKFGDYKKYLTKQKKWKRTTYKESK